MTVAEAARITKVPARTIRNWIGAGRITSKWDAGRLQVSAWEILEVADRRTGRQRLPKLPRH